MPSPVVERIESSPLTYPMRSPFVTARRTQSQAENVLVAVHLTDGIAGYGEGSPAEYVTGETPASVQADIVTAAPALVGVNVRSWRRWAAVAAEALPRSPTARAALEMALIDALARHLDLGLWEWFGGASTVVETDLTIPIADVETAVATASRASAEGFASLKMKVGGPDPAADLERVLRVAAAVPGCALRLDANQGFTVEAAIRFTHRVLDAGVRVELLEQPVAKADLEGLAAVTRAVPVPVFADEAVVSPADALRIARTGAAKGINIKLAKAGVFGALELIAVARAAGLQLMLGCMLESLPGTAVALHLAAGTGAFDYLDLDSPMLIGLETPGRPFGRQGRRLILDSGCAGSGWEPAPVPA